MKFCEIVLAAIGLSAISFANAAENQLNAKSGEHWVGTWATAQRLAPMVAPRFAARLSNANRPPPSASPIPPFPERLSDQTVRMIVRTSIGGRQVRVQLSNAQGNEPLLVGAAHVALRDKDSGIVAKTDRTLTFGGNPSVTVMPGAMSVSDPVDLAVAPLTELAVSLYLPTNTVNATVHALGLHTTYVVNGNATGSASLANATTNKSYFWLTGVEVLAPTNAAAIVAFGDSITDGYSTTPDTHRAWPAVLAARLQDNPATAHWSVVNMGISGNQIRGDGAGLSALARFDRDVLSRPGVRWIVMLEGINDINISGIPGLPETDRTSAGQLIEAYGQFVDRAHLHGIKVMGATIMPTEGLWLHNEATEAKRQAVNQWIRTSGKFDAVVDFDAVTRDPLKPRRLRPEFDPGDHIHPNDAGNAAMANAIDLTVFAK